MTVPLPSESDVERAMLGDRHRLRRQVRAVRQSQREGKPFDKNLERLVEQLERSVKRRQERLDRRPAVIRYDDELPVSSRREEIAAAIRDNQVVIVCGETGSGKSTQLPKICLELGRGVDAMIGHTQPRRIAARSIATRIAEELASSTQGAALGTLGAEGSAGNRADADRSSTRGAPSRTPGASPLVGYKIRFNDETGPHTFIKLLTDGMLLAETQHDRFLDQYDTLIIDEAHERSLNIDFLLGYVKRLMPKRPDLRLIITSATIDASRFSEHFGTAKGPAPVIEVSGRTYPVEVRYRPPEPDEEGDDPDIYAAVADAFTEITRDEPGDVLVFLPTEHAIHEAAKQLRSRWTGSGGRAGNRPIGPGGRETEILPLYARLTSLEQQRVFATHAHRRIVLATNVAESSLTVPGIRAVIDTGTARISRYSARSKVQRLPIEAVSQASANQRAGRCGRVGPGICVRLYAEDDYLAREEYTQPEIQRTNLAAVILQAKSLDLGPIEEFPFLDPPKPEALRDGYNTLFELGALDENRNLTPIGRQLSRLPVDPRIGRMILAAREQGCLHEVLIIAAALEIQDPRDRPHDKQQQADEAHARFANETSDFLSYLSLWEFYHAQKEKLSKSQLKKSCQQNFLSPTRMWEWIDVHRQLAEVVKQEGAKRPERSNGPTAPPLGKGGRGGSRSTPAAHKVGAANRKTNGGGPGSSTQGRQSSTLGASAQEASRDSAAIHRALLTGLLSSIAFKGEEIEYTAAGGGKFHLWPGSGLFAKKPKWVVAAELVETTRRYLRIVGRIDPAWIEPLAAHLVNRSHSDPHWVRETSSVMAFEKVSLFGLTIVPRRRIRYGLIDAAKSRELFIQHALVEGEFDTSAAFLEHNRKVVESLKELQKKTRRSDYLPEDQVRFEFYNARLPADVFDGQSFEKWRRDAERTNPRTLLMAPEDLLKEDVDEVAPEQFPDEIAVRQMELPLEYKYEPGGASDGITLTIPKAALNQLDPRRLGWLVPGLLEEKIAAMIKSLPKDLRRQFVPVPDTAKRVMQELKFGEGDFATAVAGILRKLSGETIPPEAFQAEKLPDHLRMNVRVVDDEGKALAAARDLQQLRKALGAEASADFSDAETGQWNRDGLTTWDFGTLPKSVAVIRGGVLLEGFPAVIDRGETASLRLVDCPHKAAFLSRAGMRRLFSLAAKRDLRSQVDWLPNINQILMISATLSTFGREAKSSANPQARVVDFREQIADLIADRAFFETGDLPATEFQFKERVKLGKNRVSVAVQDVTKVVSPVITAYNEARHELGRSRPATMGYAVEDARQQMALLVEPGFLTTTRWEWLNQYPRYFKAICLRLTRLNGDGLPRDQKQFATFLPRWKKYVERRRQHAERDLYDPALVHYRWMLEEHRVSLFAQALGTGIQISEKRLDEQWEKVRA